MPIPLLILSDAPTAGTGLARITRDLAVRVAQHLPDVYRVGTYGYGGPYSSKLPFHQYEIQMENWVCLNFEEVWEDFAGAEKGIVLAIWDASRLLWLSRPENCANARLRKFLVDRPFDLWTYTPMDAVGPHGKLTGLLGHTLEGFDRVLAYSKWAEDILRKTLCKQSLLDTLTNLPHGIDTSVFHPRHRNDARHRFGMRIGAKNRKGNFVSIPDDALAIGIVATNQMRKDWGLGIQTVAEIAQERPIFLWAHIDVLERYWSLPALLNDYGMTDNTVVTSVAFTDEQMSWNYSAMDVTLGIGLGEGFGLPIFESLACGTPCVHGNYGGAPEHMPKEFLVAPNYTYRFEGVYNCMRPVFTVDRWVGAINYIPDNELKAELPSYLDWNNLWSRWEKWFRDGVI